MRAPSILPMRAENLAFEAGGQALLGPLSFELPKGGITAMIGPNGAGKSLLLRLCHGLLAPSAGRVAWAVPGGLLAERGGRAIRRHAMLFQRPVMLRRSARANLQHALAVTGGTRAVGEAMARFGLAELAERPARLLSGGEQQRLALARAWLLEPDMLFLDEPSSQLDPGATRQIEAMLETLASEGVTLLMTTHDLGQARRLAQRVLFLHRGRLLEDRAAGDFFREPRTEEARRFLAGDLLW